MSQTTSTAANPWSDIQPRYRAYCLAHDAATPAEMLGRDREYSPGGYMLPFQRWMTAQWQAWRVATGRQGAVLTLADREEFDLWLTAIHQ